MARLVVAELRAVEDGVDTDGAGVVVCDATGAEVDVGAMAADVWDAVEGSLGVEPPGRALVGTRVRVHWPDDGAWYAGLVTEFSTHRGHQVVYDHVPGESDLTMYEDFAAVEWERAPSPPPPSLPPPLPPPPTMSASPSLSLPSPRVSAGAFAHVDWVLENPLNALWLVLFTRHPRFAKWHSVVLSYCKLLQDATPYRKTTRFLSSVPSAATYPPPCSPTAPCILVQERGRHSKAIGEMDPERSILGYYARSHVPASIVADFLEAVVARRLVGGVTRLLLVDLCAGQQSARVGVGVYQRRAVWARHRDAGCEICYVSVDCNGACAPSLHLDLLSVGMDEVLSCACLAAGWEDPDAVAVFVWFSPPCETVPTPPLLNPPAASRC